MLSPTPRHSDVGPLPDGAVGAVRATLDRPCAHFFTRHLTMRDGTRIAIDVHLPPEVHTGRRLPTILHQTRYFRATALRPPVSWVLGPTFASSSDGTRNRFLSNGYAWVDVDARGSGASFGSRPHPWSKDEVRDGAEILDWIVRQPWSSGRVGSTGVSYAGTTAEFLASNGHPALKAIAPRFSLFDVYSDIAFPGGIHLHWFTERWGELNGLIDANRYGEAFAIAIRMIIQGVHPFARVQGPAWQAALTRILDRDGVQAALALGMSLASPGVRPVDADPMGDLVRQAVAEHGANFDVHAEALAITHRDDPAPSPPHDPLEVFSPHRLRGQVEASGIPVLNLSGWLDGAYSHAAVKRFHGIPTVGSRLVLGPWEHGGKLHTSPYGDHRGAHFDQNGELVAFFDLYVKEDPACVAAQRPVHYFTMGEERWKSASEWPPAEVQIERWHLASEGRLRPGAPESAAGRDRHRVDPRSGTGPQSRWNCLIGTLPRVGYPDRAERDRLLLCYDSAPLSAPLEVTGHPLLRLYLRSTTPDATLFAYLEDLGPDGRIRYVTEGMMRALHRKISAHPSPYPLTVPHHSYERGDAEPMAAGEVHEIVFDLLPISHRFATGHRLRLAIAGADCDHFARLDGPAPELEIQRGARHPSHLELPCMPT